MGRRIGRMNLAVPGSFTRAGVERWSELVGPRVTVAPGRLSLWCEG
jgi:hypothetical protein